MSGPRSSPNGARRRVWALAIGVALVAAAGALVRDQIRPRRLAEVEAGWLYRSGRLSPLQARYARDVLGIEWVIDLTPANAGRDAEEAAVRGLGVRWLNFPLNGDGTGSAENYAAAIAAIDSAHREGRKVLVHCHAGIRRTGGVLVAYLALVGGAPMDAVIRELGRFSPDPARDSVALAHLESHLPEIVQRLELRGVSLTGDPRKRLALLRDLVGERRVAARGPAEPRG